MTSNSINSLNSGGQYLDGVVLQGYHKKLKTMKKKYFVLSGDDGTESARLEYFDNEKKFKSKSKPKRVIILKNCFNINRRLDTKQKYVIALSTKEGCFCIVLESEQEMNKWLRALLMLQRGEDTESEPLKPNFEHVWQVQIQKRGLAEGKGFVGTYHVCLTEKSLTLLRIGQERTLTGESRLQSVELTLTTIRRCGNTQCFFYLEVGRHSVIGAGELWMETEDPMIASNMHDMILNAMKTKTREDTIGPMRQRSSSANEASKPPSVLQRRQTHSGQKTISSSPLSALSSSVCHQRALSLPIGGDTYLTNHDTINNSTSMGTNLIMTNKPSYNSINHINLNNHNSNSTNSIITTNITTTTTSTTTTSTTINSINNTNCNNINTTNTTNPQTILNNVKCSHYNNYNNYNNTNNNNNIIVSSLKPFHQRTRSLPLTEETAISSSSYNQQIGAQSTNTLKFYQNNTNNFNNNNHNNNGFNHNNGFINNNNTNTNGGIQCPCKSQHNFLCIHHSCKGFTNNNCSFVLTPPNNNHLGSTLGRERCDSLPSSRNRTISECSNQSINNATMPPPRVIPSMINRPHSVYNNRHSHSPPMNALSPSTGCSESEGSSLSIDETDSYGNSLIHDESGNHLVLYYNPRTSSSGVIIEENCDDWLQPEKGHILIPDKLNNHGSMSLSISSNHQMSLRKGGSPASNCHIGSMDGHSQYMDMCSPYSPCGSSPCDQTGNGYVPISPGLEYPPKIGFNGSSTGGHSRGSSLAEENTEGYVPMGPPHPHDYVDMSQTSKNHHGSNMSLAASSSSITSGTPSTDLRFAEYTLEKVQSRFTPDDEEIQGLNEQRPARAYSVGSRIEHKRKLIPTNTAEQNSSRVRAFSVGSRAKVARSDLYRGVFNSNQMSNNINNNNTIHQDIVENISDVAKGKKSSSVPILVNKSQSSVDRMSDLMEIDYSKNSDRSDSQSDTMSSPTTRVSSFPVTVPMSSNRTRCDTYSGSPLTNTAPISGYMEMKPGSYDKTISSSPLSKSNYNGYLEMKPGAGSSNSSLGNGIYAKSSSSFSGSPLKATSSPKPFTKSFTITGNESSSSDYITMSPSTSMSPAMANNSMDKNFMSNMPSSCDKPMDIDHFPILSQTPEGYMEMSYGKSSSSSSSSSTNQKSENIAKLIDENEWSVNRSPSLPINIKTTKEGKTVPGLSFSETLMRTLSQSSETKEHDLPTPVNNQTTQFMFSPSSPIKSIVGNDFTQRKCLVDATSGSITITPKTEDESSMQSITPEKYKILNTDHVNSVAKKNNEKVEALVNDYADLSLNASSKNVQTVKMPQKNLVKPIVITAESNDYVNYAPGDANKPTNLNVQNLKATISVVQPKSVEKKIINDSDGDYAVMNPSLTKKYKSVVVSTPSSPSSSSSQASNSVVNCKKIQSQDRKPTTNLLGFKPISSVNDEALLAATSASISNRKSASPKATLNASTSTSLRSDKKHRKNDSDSGYEMIHIGSDSSIQAKRNEISMHARRNLSRPNSVNSEKISPMKGTAGNRPNSANSDCIQSISASSSTSTLCGSSSSSSTLCGGSKSQSPLSISRPPSIIDYLIGGVGSGSGACGYQGNDSTTDINLLTVRPSSVTSEKELHYASLDLPPSTTSLDTLGVNTKTNSSSPGGDSSTSPSPNANNMQQQSTFTYAKIDFNRIESHKAALKAGQGHQ